MCPSSLASQGLGCRRRLGESSYLGTLDIRSRILGFSPRAQIPSLVFILLCSHGPGLEECSEVTGQVESVPRQATQFSQCWGAGIRSKYSSSHIIITGLQKAGHDQ